MKWRVELSQDADKFLSKNELDEKDINEMIVQAVRFFQGQDTNIDIKKLKGEWKGFYRIRKRKIRVIAGFNFEYKAVFIEKIDHRGDVYK